MGLEPCRSAPTSERSAYDEWDQIRMSRQKIAIFLLFPALGPATGAGDTWERVPRESLAVLVGRPSSQSVPDSAQTMTTRLLGLALDLTADLGLMSESAARIQAWMDALVSLSALEGHPFALCLLRLDIAPTQSGRFELGELGAALIIETRDSSTIRSRIQYLLTRHTSPEQTTLEKFEVDGATFHRLRDRRLPPWCEVCWGPWKEGYLITVGRNAVDEAVAALQGKAPTLGENAWIREAQKQCHSMGVLGALYLDVAAITRERPAAFVNAAARLLDRIDLPRCERFFGVAAQDGRVFESSVYVRRAGQDQRILLADQAFLSPYGYDTIPPEATSYAVFAAPLPRLIPGVWQAYLDWRDEKARGILLEVEADIREKSGTDLAELASHLGEHLIIHDYPKHALRIPVARTILLPIAKDPAAFRNKLDRFLGALGSWVNPTEGGIPALKRTADGLWYIDLGLQGPAMKVTDKWLIISFSPTAVEANLVHRPR